MLLPTPTSVSTLVPPGTIISYTVMSGDTVGVIAIRFNSTVDAIVKENKLANANDIYAGLILKIPVNIATPVPTATVGTVYPTVVIPTNTPLPPQPPIIFPLNQNRIARVKLTFLHLDKIDEI
jgi:LysM repeat protein